jgi:MFS family permease
MLFASYADVMPVATERASLFFLTTSMQYLAQTFCPSIGAFLMNMDGKGGTPQVNLAVSFCLAILTALITIFLFPETVGESRKAAASATASAPESPDTLESSDETPPSTTTTPKSLPSNSTSLGTLNLLLLFTSILLASTGIKSIDWFGLIQYPVIKLSWTFPQASYIVACQGFLMLLHFSLLLPFLNRLAVHHLRSPVAAHFTIMLASAALLAAGSLAIGFSSTAPVFVASVVVYLFGEGLPTATQAYIVSLVEKGRVARVMAMLSIASIGGKLVASIAFPEVLALGLDAGGVLVGLPFFVAAGFFAGAAGCVLVVGVRVGVVKERKGVEGEVGDV